jgi:molybdopterin synthase sulfur carrier subunit
VPTVRIPDSLRRYTAGAGSFTVEGSTVAAALAAAFTLHPDLRIRIVDDRGEVHRHLVVFRNEQELPREGMTEAPLEPEDTLTFLEAIGGGSVHR